MANGIIITDPESFSLVFRPPVLDALRARLELIGNPARALPHFTSEEIRADPSRLAEVDYLLTSWRGPRLDAAFLRSTPRLRAVFHAAGTVKPLVTPEFWASGIPITSAHEANGLPVADFAYAQILLALKGYWALARRYHERRRIPSDRKAGPGVCDVTVGLVSLGHIARQLVARLKHHRLRLIAYDPHVSPAAAAELGVRLVSLPEVFSRSNVVSCHTPLNPETRGLIGRAELSLLRQGATFLNTARGEVVRSTELYEVLRLRPDLTALLDVTDPEPLPQESAAFDLPNLIVSPHIAGSVGHECALLAEAMIEELDRHLVGQPLRGCLTETEVALAT